MSANDKTKYYWLKLNKDFFQKHQIRVIEGMKNGREYVLFYLKIMVEATSWQGELRFSPTIPYSEEMLANLTNTPIDTVHTSMEIFKQLGLIEIWDDGTLYIEEVKRITGSETGKAIRDREYRERLKGGSEQAQTSLEIRDKSLEIREESIEDTSLLPNGRNSVSMSEQVRTSQKQRALCEILVDYGFLEENELEDPAWDALMQSLYDRLQDLVDCKVKLKYVLDKQSHYEKCGYDKQDKPIFAHRFDHSQIGNKYAWLNTALAKACDEWDRLVNMEEQLRETFSEPGEEVSTGDDDLF